MSTEESSTEIENQLMDAIPDALEDGKALLEWWEEKDPDKDYDERYEETRTRNRPDDTSYGFFDEVRLPSSGKTVPINGNVQQMFYDEAKAPPGKKELQKEAADLMHEQIRAFILKYFMRVTDFRQPELAEEGGDDEDGDITGFGFEQVYYKRRESGEKRKFDEDGQSKIVELTEFFYEDELKEHAPELAKANGFKKYKREEGGEKPYDWIVLKNPIFGFGFNFKPFGELVEGLIGVSGPEVKLPARVFNYLVISRDFVVIEEFDPRKALPGRGEDKVRARYGFGYAFVNDPEPSVYGYGPGQLQPAFEQMIWEVLDSGEIKVRAAFVAQEPKGILQLSVDPFAWGFQLTKALGGEVPSVLKPIKRMYDELPLTNTTFDPVLPTVRLLNLLTLGQAANLGLPTKDGIIKEALFIHFLQHYQTIVGSLQTWRQIKDWTAAEELPKTWKTKPKKERDAERARREKEGKLLPKWVVSGKSS